jgi:hypothetical protein
MKRFFMFLATVMTVVALQAADARTSFGVRLGFPELGVQVSNTNFFSSRVGGRITADFGYIGSNTIVLGADVLYSLPIPTQGSSIDLEAYLGGGLGVALGNRSSAYNVHLVLGLELLLNRDLGVFVEARPVVAGNYGYWYGAGLGLNIRL